MGLQEYVQDSLFLEYWDDKELCVKYAVYLGKQKLFPADRELHVMYELEDGRKLGQSVIENLHRTYLYFLNTGVINGRETKAYSSQES